MSNMLVDDPQAFAVHRHDKTGTDLAEWLQIRDFVGMWQSCGSITVRGREIRGPVRPRRRYRQRCLHRAAERRSWLKTETLRNWSLRCARQIGPAVGTDAGAEPNFLERRNYGAWQADAVAGGNWRPASRSLGVRTICRRYSRSDASAGGSRKTRDWPSAHEHLPNRIAREIVDELRPAEADFDFGRVHVDVDFVVGHFDE